MPDTDIRLGASTFSFMWAEPAIVSLRRLRSVGLNDFDVVLAPGHLWPPELTGVERRELAQALRLEGIEIESLNPPALDLNLASSVDAVRAYSVDVFCQTLRLASDLGAKGVVVVPGRVSALLPPRRTDVLHWLSDSLLQLLRLAEQLDLTLFMESHPQSPLPDVDAIVEFLARVGHRRLKVAYDVANAEFIGEAQAPALRRLAPRLGQVHLSDGTKTNWRHDGVGRGTVDFDAVVSTLDELDFTAVSVVEIISADAMNDIRHSIAALSAVAARVRARKRSVDA